MKCIDNLPAMGLESRKRNMRHLLLLLVFTTVLQSVILISLVVHWRTERIKQVRQVEKKVCYDFSNHKESARWQRDSNEPEDSNFCKRTGDILKTLTNQAVEARYDNAANPEVYPAPLQYIPHCRDSNKSLDSIQLSAISTYHIHEPGKPTKIYWSLDSFQGRDTFCKTASVESEGFIEIKENGLYLISSKLTMSVKNGTYDPSYALEGAQFRHYIMLSSNHEREEKILLENEQSKCNILAEISEKTSQIESVFKLEDGDRVFIATSHAHRINSGPHKANFLIQQL